MPTYVQVLADLEAAFAFKEAYPGFVGGFDVVAEEVVLLVRDARALCSCCVVSQTEVTRGSMGA